MTCFQNLELGDPNENHVSIHTRGNLQNSAFEDGNLGFTTSVPEMSDGKIHNVQIEYTPGDPGTLKIHMVRKFKWFFFNSIF